MPNQPAVQVSVLIISFNTKHLLQRCFDSVKASAGSLSYEIIVVDNASKDGSAEYIRQTFPEVKLLTSPENLGFAGANNLGYPEARGQYIVLLNSDAFLVGSALQDAVKLMDSRPEVGLGGARLIGEDRSWQPSARTFPGLWNDFVTLSGLSAKKPKHPLFGRPDLTYRNQDAEILCDWVPGAFSIIRKDILDKIGFFDPMFFLYYEEVDLCRRIKADGWKIAYWPQLEVIHLGGGSTGVFNEKLVQKSGKQMGLWRLQAQYLYYRKHHGGLWAWLSKNLEGGFNRIRLTLNKKKDPRKAEESQVILDLIARAWSNTKGGRVCPPRPWQGY